MHGQGENRRTSDESGSFGASKGDQTSRALAAELGIEPTMFPGGHTGFAEDPEGFAVRLRSVLRAD